MPESSAKQGIPIFLYPNIDFIFAFSAKEEPVSFGDEIKLKFIGEKIFIGKFENKLLISLILSLLLEKNSNLFNLR